MASDKWTLKLNTGKVVPAFGLGTWQSEKGVVGQAVDIAVRNGYRSIDCAWLYRNEDEIGATLETLFKEGVVKREDLFITSKLSGTHHNAEDVEECCRDTLKNLKLDYLDLYLVHSPAALKKDALLSFPNLTEEQKFGYNSEHLAKTWEVMESLVSKGLVKAIGISNFTITKTEKLLETAKIVPAVNQVECHPYFQQKKLKKYCDSKGIVLEAYAPLGSPGRPRASPDDPVVMEDPTIKQIAEKHGATAGQICISFLLHSGLMVIPKSTSEKRIKENLGACSITLSPEEIQALEGIDKNLRLFLGLFFLPKGTTVEQAWDVAADEAYSI
ncbi:PREDICTED: alcohol dehydrogenase [NADP(+)]-like isoform X9 [Amphimedon queenslandica]|uniref:NADP-dependent oxidoreductase domain-containing protein n=1 Tax=Amphimedon queenslandica TaxID=400682 RepID=A0AAN0JHH2_AMPQE|nr:PREDICTED: alcohol dehydrogenase [NADP(+)]-like isoform X9 [Amphimedon queenslandica]|eukprot:XP_019856480.1 PREDICTED: alcohol dehydrogenase [NADP(+)]-like isoform X9 [Amphimedon queenslandica]